MPVKQASESKPQTKSRLSKYLIVGENDQNLAQSLSANSKGEATSITSPIDKAAATNKNSGNAQDTKSQPSSFDVLDANTLSSGSAKKNKSGGAKTLQVNLEDDDEEEEKKSQDSWQQVELTESIVKAAEKSESQQHIERYTASFETKLNDEIEKISQKYDSQIKTYEKKGVNPLTKKLIEKAKSERAQAIEKRQKELEAEKLRNIDKIKAGLMAEEDLASLDIK